MKKETLEISFGGENEIDLDTLSESLRAVTNTLEIIAENSLGENDYCKFKVKAFKTGSFKVSIEQIIELAPALFPVMPDILSSFSSIVSLRQSLGGRQPKKIENHGTHTEVQNADGDITNINSLTMNVYLNEPDIEKNLSYLSEAVYKDDSRTSLSIEAETGNENISVDMDRDDLLRTSQKLDVDLMNNNVDEQEATMWLIIRKPDFLMKSQWQFQVPIYDNKNIYAEMLDEDFNLKVLNKKINFPADISEIEARMLITIKDNKTTNYKVIKVLNTR